jgi:hypothetical protein
MAEELLAEVLELALTIVPEIPFLYLFAAPPDGMPSPANVTAYAITKCCPKLQDILAAKGEARGDAPAIVLCRQFNTPTALLETLIHELSHCLPFFAADYAAGLTLAERGRCELAIAAFSTNPSGELPNRPPWFPDHDKNFIRICVHLWWRAAILGHFTSLDGIAAGNRYGLTPLTAYWECLAAEPVLMKDREFSEILATPAPAAFENLWRDDLVDWMQRHPDDVHKIQEEAKIGDTICSC